MKIQIASDLHLEFLQRRYPAYRAVEPCDADLLILAGDIHQGSRALQTFSDWPCPVLLLHGNHELYGTVAADALADLAVIGTLGSVTYLEQQSIVLAGVRFLGCCLWTDYALDGDAPLAMRLAEHALMDHQVIRTPSGKFLPQDALAMHVRARRWLARELGTPFAGPTVVCTHHAPHAGSIHPQYQGNPHNPAFISDLSGLLGMADLWIHGHVHNSFDYRVGAARVVANPRGYALNLRSATSLEGLRWENPAFESRKCVTI